MPLYGKRLETLFEGINLSKTGAKYEPLLFLLRRSLVAALLVFLTDKPMVATIALLAITLVMFVYNIVVRPYKYASVNCIAIANEVFLAVFICLVYALPYLSAASMLGWALIIFVVLIIYANVMVMMGNAWLHLKQLCKREQTEDTEILRTHQVAQTTTEKT